MEPYDRTLRDFARRLGLERLPVNAAGAAELAIERVGRLHLEPADGHVMVTLARPVPARAERLAGAALDLCHWRENHPWPVHAGLKGGEWVALVARIPEREFDLPAAERAVGYLAAALDRLEADAHG